MEEPTVTPLKFSWELLQVEGTPPTPRFDKRNCSDYSTLSLLFFRAYRFGHACAMVDNKLYVFGGASNDDSGAQVYLNDMYTLEG